MLFQSPLIEPSLQKNCDRSRGISILHKGQRQGGDTALRLRRLLETLGAQAYLIIDSEPGDSGLHLQVTANARLIAQTLDFDTTMLATKLGLDVAHSDSDLDLEIVLSMARSPFSFTFPGIDEFEAAIRMRRHVVRIAALAQLSFGTGAGEVRPTDFFSFHPDTSFTLNPGMSLVQALSEAINPPNSERAYSFSCYRASEYVMALALARELEGTHPALLSQMQSRWMRQPIMSKEFHEILLFEYGSLEDPVPMRFYVPGDRVWFKNPDAYSSDVIGFEGSWVCYLGGGHFNNFWKSNQPFTLQSKCLEIYHWRHGVVLNAAGEMQMNEEIVEQCVLDTLSTPGGVDAVLDKMLRFRDPGGVYEEGGCIDATREHLRWVNPLTTNITIPPVKLN